MIGLDRLMPDWTDRRDGLNNADFVSGGSGRLDLISGCP